MQGRGGAGVGGGRVGVAGRGGGTGGGGGGKAGKQVLTGGEETARRTFITSENKKTTLYLIKQEKYKN